MLSLAAHKWLREAGAYAPPHDLHLLTLASWGLENGVQGEWPSRGRSALEEQEENLRQALVWAQNARQAAAVVLNEIYSRMKSQLPALQPAASEFPWDSKE